MLKPIKGRKPKEVKLSSSHTSLWAAFDIFYKSKCPPLIYYPNFLFEFPEKIYIDKKIPDDQKQEFYYKFIQDILDSIESGLNVESSLLARSIKNDENSRKALSSTINRMESELNSLVKTLEMFNFNQANRRIEVTSPQIDSENERRYIEVKVREGNDSFDVSERSLGFRWFLTFALLTQFRIKRKSSEQPVFIFDEPASNLHQRNQERLLKSLHKLVSSSRASVIYSTHSHHLINPAWLDSAFIVRNEGLKKENEQDFISSMSDIKVYTYREFVNEYSEETDYFQPILDSIEYIPNKMEKLLPTVIVEGKNDYYTLLNVSAIGFESFSITPGFGVERLNSLIAFYLGLGKDFIVLLDSDQPGVDAKAKYLDTYGVVLENKIFTLGDVDKAFSNKSMESLFEKAEKVAIQKVIFPLDTSYNKKRFNRALQEIMAVRHSLEFLPTTQENFAKLSKFVMDKLKPKAIP